MGIILQFKIHILSQIKDKTSLFIIVQRIIYFYKIASKSEPSHMSARSSAWKIVMRWDEGERRETEKGGGIENGGERNPI